MALSAETTSAPRNRLLAALPPEDLARLRPQLEPAELSFRQVLHVPGEPIISVYFPETGWASMLAYLEEDDAAEVGLVGCEGMIGLPVLLGAECDDIEGMVQCPGTALRMNVAAFREALERLPPSAPSCFATRWSTTGRWHARPPATDATILTSASRAGC